MLETLFPRRVSREFKKNVVPFWPISCAFTQWRLLITEGTPNTETLPNIYYISRTNIN